MWRARRLGYVSPELTSVNSPRRIAPWRQAMDKVKELVVTLRVPSGDVVRVDELQSSGERRELSEQEFAELVARGEEESLVAALEEAYAAGAEDASDEAETAADVRILWDAAARLRLRNTVRQLVLARALRRMAAAPEQPAEAKTALRRATTKKGAGHARGSHAGH